MPRLFAARTAVVDHHSSNPGFPRSTGWMATLRRLPCWCTGCWRPWVAPFPAREAVCLYTGLSTDTGNFIYESTSAESFRMMAALMDAGLPLAEYARRLFRVKGAALRKAAGRDAAHLRLILRGKVAGITLTAAQMRKTGAKAGHTDGLVDYAIDLEGG